MKRFLLVVAILVILGYLVFSTLYFEGNTHDKVCENFKVMVKDSLDKQFIQAADIEQLLKRAKLHPIGKPLADINTMEMEEAIRTNKLVKSVEVYITQSGSIVASIHQRNPVMRIISHRDGSYYIDSERVRMPTSQLWRTFLITQNGMLG